MATAIRTTSTVHSRGVAERFGGQHSQWRAVHTTAALATAAGKALKLDAIVHLEQWEKETPENVRKLWLAFHHSRKGLAAVLPEDTYAKLQERGQATPTFVFPFPRDEGFINMVMQAQLQHGVILFTFLSDFQQQGAHALPALTLEFYSELAASKGLVLMRGVLSHDDLRVEEAQAVTNLCQLYLLSDDAHRRDMMHSFNHEPHRFNHEAVLDDIVSSGLQAPAGGDGEEAESKAESKAE